MELPNSVNEHSAAPPCSPLPYHVVMDFIVVYGVFECLCEVLTVADGFVESYSVFRLNDDGSKGEIMEIDIEDEVQRRYAEYCACDE